ncbi:MAG: ABC transporter ATP-binding protein/permease [Spirochaetaceae bacterium]|nr:ABC transporter ATP-binding protein/permease [Spirochaetaceae bacterium]MCF7938749.1 ABC transporter ATP-binding protein/permease [Spirochaetales bacterium]
MISVVKKLLYILSKKEKRKLVFVFFGILVMGFLEVIGVGSIMPFISVASEPKVVETNVYLSYFYELFAFDSVSNFLFALGIAVAGFILISNFAKTGIIYIVKKYSALREHHISMRLLTRYISQPYVYFLDKNSSELIKNILEEVRGVVKNILLPFLETITNLVVCIFIVAMLIIVNPALAFIVAIVLSSSYGIIYFFTRKKLIKIGIERLEANRLRFKYTTDAFGGIKIVKISGKEKSFIEQYKHPSRLFALNDAYKDILGQIPKYGLETIAFGGMVLIILFLIKVEGTFNNVLPVISLYAFAGYKLMPAMQKVFRGITRLRYNSPVLDLVYEDVKRLKRYALPVDSNKIEQLELKNKIELIDILFRYPNSQKEIIKRQSFTIDANTTIGLVGPTGCGKTTLVDIILGLLTPQEGAMYIDKTKITEENFRNWQANIGYVPQSIFLTDDTIARNIAFGIPQEEIDINAVKRAAEVANLDVFIKDELEKGYETVVGERGVRLSGGQRQRIGIARAVYHNPSVLILDEATSALDGLTEQAIMDAIHNLSHKKTIIMIAHRLTTVKECDAIHILDKGRIIDSGQYEELIKRNEEFRKMAEG